MQPVLHSRDSPAPLPASYPKPEPLARPMCGNDSMFPSRADPFADLFRALAKSRALGRCFEAAKHARLSPPIVPACGTASPRKLEFEDSRHGKFSPLGEVSDRLDFKSDLVSLSNLYREVHVAVENYAD